MYKILKKEKLNDSVTRMVIKAPFVAKKAEPGQFIILRVDKDGERVPFTIADYDRENETVTIIFQVVGAETSMLNLKNEGDYIEYILISDDGSTGKQGFVTDALKELIDSGEKYDLVMAIGPIPMMKFVSKLTKEYGIKTIVSMNPIMIDGTGMCGGCRLTVGGETKFACVDGPEFDGHLVDFDEAMERGAMYRKFEREEECNLFGKEVQ